METLLVIQNWEIEIKILFLFFIYLFIIIIIFHFGNMKHIGEAKVTSRRR